MLDIWTDIDRQMYYLSYTWVVDLVYFWFSFSLNLSGQQLQGVIFVLIIQVAPNFSFYQRPLFGYRTRLTYSKLSFQYSVCVKLHTWPFSIDVRQQANSVGVTAFEGQEWM